MDLIFPSDIWYDRKKIIGGDPIHKGVEEGVRDADIVIVFISKQSLSSNWVDLEWRTKHEDEIKSGKVRVIAAIVDDTDLDRLPPFLTQKRVVRIRADFRSADIRELAGCTCIQAARYLKMKFTLR